MRGEDVEDVNRVGGGEGGSVWGGNEGHSSEGNDGMDHEMCGDSLSSSSSAAAAAAAGEICQREDGWERGGGRWRGREGERESNL